MTRQIKPEISAAGSQASSSPGQFLDGIWAAVPTPFSADGRLDIPGVESNARHFAQTLALEGLFCNGLMGEVWSLSLAERKAALEAHIGGASGRLRVGVVTTHHSLAETIELSQHAAEAGADHVVLFRPQGIFSADELHDYVVTVCEQTGIPVVLFDSEAQNGGYPADVVRRLGEARRIRGVKCTRRADAIVELRMQCGDVVTVTDPYEAHCLENLLRLDLRVLYADPEPYLYQTEDCQLVRDYFAAHQAAHADSALAKFRRLEPLRQVYEDWVVEPLRRGAPFNAALKHWCGRMGLAAGPVRAPLRPLRDSEERTLDEALTAAFAAVFEAKGDP
jgi:4-hydroxy-tetrahydrodipicolinate synthase